jgi:hypothetical protein
MMKKRKKKKTRKRRKKIFIAKNYLGLTFQMQFFSFLDNQKLIL